MTRPDAAPANYRGPWSPDTDYAVDDTCSRHGRYWQALVAHGAAYAGTWGTADDRCMDRPRARRLTRTPPM